VPAVRPLAAPQQDSPQAGRLANVLHVVVVEHGDQPHAERDIATGLQNRRPYTLRFSI
jgi:hypothetical protein